ncbi:MAG: ABC transporter ATP-binding protein [Fibrobacteria bacterium]|nr:ABC transporter ATP-binding protein [Fibrobacteria bacterium]
MATNKLILRTTNLCKSYQLGKESLQVLCDVGLEITSGEFVAIMGQSGSGKSTLLNILGCLDTPTSGEYYLNEVLVNGLSQSRLADIRNHDIGFVFQNFNLLPKLDLIANVELPMIYGNVPKDKRKKSVEMILKQLGLWERRFHRPNEISGGQKQRVAIARALVKQPAIILADEPTGNLDSTTTEEILVLFEQLHKEGNTILVITHEPEVASRAQKVYKLLDGVLTEDR